ncbi:MAG TPA: type II secretion system F family protein [Tepidisphaeraceae bacterium]|jgi:tight adherence protein B
MGDSILFILLLALTVAVLGGLLVQMIFTSMESKRRALQDRLGTEREAVSSPYGPLVMDDPAEASGLAKRSELLGRFSRKLHRAYPGVMLGRFLALILILGFTAFMAGAVGMNSVTIGLIAAGMAVTVPFLRVSAKCAKRLRMIDEQLPDALDFLSRILRAGHSLTTGFQMASEELPEPLAGELRTCYDQHSLGAPLENAMRDMAERVGTADFAFFVTAVLIQRQTGGDLAEVLNNISNMVRARLRLQQHVKAITAQGRLVGMILLVMPIFFFFILYSLNPDYAGILLREREGVIALSCAAGLQFLGMITIKRITAVQM